MYAFEKNLRKITLACLLTNLLKGEYHQTHFGHASKVCCNQYKNAANMINIF